MSLHEFQNCGCKINLLRISETHYRLQWEITGLLKLLYIIDIIYPFTNECYIYLDKTDKHLNIFAPQFIRVNYPFLECEQFRRLWDHDLLTAKQVLSLLQPLNTKSRQQKAGFQVDDFCISTICMFAALSGFLT